MAKEVTSAVEFIGGPFDGHVQRFASDEGHLPEDLIWPVSENVFRILHGQERAAAGRVTSVAVYRLGSRGDDRCYRYAGAISPRETGKRWVSGLVRSLFHK